MNLPKTTQLLPPGVQIEDMRAQGILAGERVPLGDGQRARLHSARPGARLGNVLYIA